MTDSADHYNPYLALLTGEAEALHHTLSLLIAIAKDKAVIAPRRIEAARRVLAMVPHLLPLQVAGLAYDLGLNVPRVPHLIADRKTWNRILSDFTAVLEAVTILVPTEKTARMVILGDPAFTLEEVKQAHVAQVFAKSRTQQVAATALGLTLSTLWRWGHRKAGG